MPHTYTLTVSRSLRDSIRDALCAGDFDSSLASEIYSELGSELDVCQCERCDSYTRDYASVDNGNEIWCDDCLNSHAYYWESDSEYHSEPEPEDDPDREGIEEYHGTDRDELCAEVDFDNPTILGIEIETYLQTPGDDIHRARRATRGQSPNWTAEDDGSLDDKHGVELVFAPVTLSELQESYGKTEGVFGVVDSLQSSGGIAWDAGTGYGMHVSVNAAQMTELHCAKFIRMVNDNRAECERIAGRSETSWAKYLPASKLANERKPNGKYLAAARRSDSRIEVRIFRATLNKARILRNCEFVDALRVYTQNASFGSLDFHSFREWLALPAQSRYVALRKFYHLVPNSDRTSTESRFPAMNVCATRSDE